MISSALMREIPDSTIDVWTLLLETVEDHDLIPATLDVLREWETGFPPQVAHIIRACEVYEDRRDREYQRIQSKADRERRIEEIEKLDERKRLLKKA